MIRLHERNFALLPRPDRHRFWTRSIALPTTSMLTSAHVLQPSGDVLIDGREYNEYQTLLPIECKRPPTPVAANVTNASI